MPIQITTTSDDKHELEQIAKRLIDDRLAACCQVIGPMTSFYRWQEKIEEATEWLCLIKTSSEMFNLVELAIREQHHYDQPEIIAVEIVKGSQGYLDWLENNVS